MRSLALALAAVALAAAPGGRTRAAPVADEAVVPGAPAPAAQGEDAEEEGAGVVELVPPPEGEEPEEGAGVVELVLPPAPPPLRLILDLGAYYSSAGFYVRLGAPPPVVTASSGEGEVYRSLLPRSLAPGFVVAELSVNPMPCLGLALREWRGGYDRAQVTDDLNLVRAATAGFDEPWAASVFLGNVVDFELRDRPEVRGKGYLGLVASAGSWHIKDNALVDDPWLELEVKLKGTRRAPARNLAWSVRAGVKLNRNRDVTDAAFVAVRRSRVDFEPAPWWIANSGVEYRFDLSLDGRPLRHVLVVDRKWPVPGRRIAFSLGIGVLWDEGGRYAGALAEGHRSGLQLLVRPGAEL